jgi:hypothetical protein
MRRAAAVLALVLPAGCSGSPPGLLVGQSAHFRLYVDPALMPVAPPFDGDNALAALETEWSDVETMLHMPDGTINYYWTTPEHAAEACGAPDEGACTKEAELEIDSPTLPNPHELNHAYLYLRKQREPIPFLAEGAAEAIGCGITGTPFGDHTAWPDLVAALPDSDEVYLQGGLLARYLIRTSGVDAFLRYYEQSPEERDPALFAANFHAFWGMTVDDVWAAMHTEVPGTGTDFKICPCSLPPPAADGTITNDLARAPYWSLGPIAAGESLALTGGPYADILDCGGGGAPAGGSDALARIDLPPPSYMMAPLAAAATGPYLADDCESAAPYVFPADLAITPTLFSLAVSRTAAPRTVYFQLQFPLPAWQIDTYPELELCDSCAFDHGSCQPMTAPSRMPLSAGATYGRVTVPGGAPGAEAWTLILWPPL